MGNLIEKIFEEIKKDQINDELKYFNFHKNRFKTIFFELSKEENADKIKFLDLGSHYLHACLGAHFLGCKQILGADLNYFNSKVKNRSEKYSIKLNDCNLADGNIPFDSNFLDFVLFSETLEHLNFHPKIVFSEIYRILKPGGKLIITTPNLNRLNNRIKIILGRSINFDIGQEYSVTTHYREYTGEELRYLLTKVGFQKIKIKYISFNYPNTNCLVKMIDLFFGLFFKSTRSNLLIIAEKL
jgi:SAM-dependent methyltransferase